MPSLLILGGGESGVGAALLAHHLGIDCAVSDSGTLKTKYKEELSRCGIPYEEGGHSAVWLDSAEEVVKSPGIPPSAAPLRALRERQVPIYGEIEFAARHLPKGAKVVGITGSNGKTTSVTWLTHILQQAGMDAVACGNVGESLARKLIEPPHAVYVVELSSFQLDDTLAFTPDIAVLLNITPDHLDRYEHSLALYAAAKWRITRKLGPEQTLVYWGEDATIATLLQGNEPFSTVSFSLTNRAAAYYSEEQDALIFAAMGNAPELVLKRELLALKGKHNILNALAVGLAARKLGVQNAHLAAALTQFINVAHRLEPSGVVNGVSYINDSKATNIDSTRYALEAQTQPTVLILGGTDKGNDYDTIADLVRTHCCGLIFLAVDKSKLHATFDGMMPICDASSMQEAVNLAHAMAKPGDVVLLSPACASFDLFNNYEDRGEQFKQEVKTLMQQ